MALLDPGEGWAGAPESLPFSSAPDILHIASVGGPQSTLGQVTFTGAQLRQLDGSTVLVNAGASAPGSDHRSSRADFDTHACDHIDD